MLAAVRAPAVDLKPVRRDIVSSAAGEFFEQVLDVAGGKIEHRPTLGTDDVMVMPAAGEPVFDGAVVQHHLAQRPEILKQPQGAEDGRAAYPGRGHH